MSESNVLKLDIDSLTEFQKELHEPIPGSDPKDPKNHIKSRFSCHVEKSAWSAHTKSKMSYSVEEGEVIYTSSKKYDVLFGSELSIKLLPIKVKEGCKDTVQICYPHNPGHNICGRGELKVDDEHHQTIDTVWLDIHSQYFMKNGAGKRDLYNRMVGNLPCLEQWNTELPSVPLLVPQPYYYSRNTKVALRTLRSSMNVVKHHYKMRTKINDIIRMRVRSIIGVNEQGEEEYGEWKKCVCNLSYLDIPNNMKEIPIPELRGKYAIMSDSEREWNKFDPVTKEPVKHIIYTEDIFTATSNNPTPTGDTDIIPLQCIAPASQIHWVAQQVDFPKYNNYSNYTTDKESVYYGFNPCVLADLKYGAAYRYEGLNVEDTECSSAWYHGYSAPCESGYNTIPLNYNSGNLNVDTSVVLNPLNATLHVKLGDSNPLNAVDETEINHQHHGKIIPVEALDDDTAYINNRNRYIIHVRILVYKKLEMSWNKDAKCIKYILHEDATK
jgi:hypothetical protein